MKKNKTPIETQTPDYLNDFSSFKALKAGAIQNLYKNYQTPEALAQADPKHLTKSKKYKGIGEKTASSLIEYAKRKTQVSTASVEEQGNESATKETAEIAPQYQPFFASLLYEEAKPKEIDNKKSYKGGFEQWIKDKKISPEKTEKARAIYEKYHGKIYEGNEGFKQWLKDKKISPEKTEKAKTIFIKYHGPIEAVSEEIPADEPATEAYEPQEDVFEAKEDFEDEYTRDDANFDIAVAEEYLNERDYGSALESCEPVLDFYRTIQEEDLTDEDKENIELASGMLERIKEGTSEKPSKEDYITKERLKEIADAMQRGIDEWLEKIKNKYEADYVSKKEAGDVLLAELRKSAEQRKENYISITKINGIVDERAQEIYDDLRERTEEILKKKAKELAEKIKRSHAPNSCIEPMITEAVIEKEAELDRIIKNIQAQKQNLEESMKIYDSAISKINEIYKLNGQSPPEVLEYISKELDSYTNLKTEYEKLKSAAEEALENSEKLVKENGELKKELEGKDEMEAEVRAEYKDHLSEDEADRAICALENLARAEVEAVYKDHLSPDDLKNNFYEKSRVKEEVLSRLKSLLEEEKYLKRGDVKRDYVPKETHVQELEEAQKKVERSLEILEEIKSTHLNTGETNDILDEIVGQLYEEMEAYVEAHYTPNTKVEELKKGLNKLLSGEAIDSNDSEAVSDAYHSLVEQKKISSVLPEDIQKEIKKLNDGDYISKEQHEAVLREQTAELKERAEKLNTANRNLILSMGIRETENNGGEYAYLSEIPEDESSMPYDEENISAPQTIESEDPQDIETVLSKRPKCYQQEIPKQEATTPEEKKNILLGAAYSSIEEKDYESALRYLKEISNIDPDDKDVCIKIGTLNASTGKPREALLYYQKALNIDPEYEKAKKSLEVIKKGFENMDKTLLQIEEYLDIPEKWEKSFRKCERILAYDSENRAAQKYKETLLKKLTDSGKNIIPEKIEREPIKVRRIIKKVSVEK